MSRYEPTADDIARVRAAISEARYDGFAIMAEVAIRAMDRRASPPAPTVAEPEGWKLVPVEQTDEMLKAAEDTGSWWNYWPNMLAAAPTPPAAEAPGQEPVAYRARRSLHEKWYYFDNPVGWWECQPLFPAPPASAEAEARAFARGIEAAANSLDDEAGDLERIAQSYRDGDHRGKPEFLKRQAEDFSERSDAVRQMADHVRSLASPAPKGVT